MVLDSRAISAGFATVEAHSEQRDLAAGMQEGNNRGVVPTAQGSAAVDGGVGLANAEGMATWIVHSEEWT